MIRQIVGRRHASAVAEGENAETLRIPVGEGMPSPYNTTIRYTAKQSFIKKTKKRPDGRKKRNDPWTEVLSNLSAKGHFCSLLVSNIIGYLAFLGSDV